MEATSSMPYILTDLSEPSHSDQRLKDKVAVITGACSGIGLSTTKLFLAHGAYVVGGDIKKEEGLELENTYPKSFKFQYCDVTKESDIQSIMAVANEKFQRIDILINNAGATVSQKTIRNIDGEDWSKTMKLVLESQALGIRYVIPFMDRLKGGSIINMGSIAGIQATTAPLPYSVAKAGVIHLTKITAAQLGKNKIRVNSISPGFIITSIYDDPLKTSGIPESLLPQVKQEMIKGAKNAQPLPQAGTTDDIANACLFLASDDSKFITGANLVIDGGMTTGLRDVWEPELQAARMKALLSSVLKPSTQAQGASNPTSPFVETSSKV